jgi:hypothetical protein
LDVDELVTTEDEEVLDVDVVGSTMEELVLLEVDWTTLLLKTRDVNSYISKRLPAPQYSYALPGQMKEQSLNVANTDPVFMVLPQ